MLHVSWCCDPSSEINQFFFSQASERAGILNSRIWSANDALVAGPAFYDTAHGPSLFLLGLNFAPKS